MLFVAEFARLIAFYRKQKDDDKQVLSNVRNSCDEKPLCNLQFAMIVSADWLVCLWTKIDASPSIAYLFFTFTNKIF